MITATVNPGPDGSEVIWLRTPFELKDQVKELTGRKWFGPPVYEDGPKVWTIPAEPRSALEFHQRFSVHTVMMDDAVKALVAQGRDLAKTTIIKNAQDLPDIPTKTTAWAHQRQGFHFAKHHPGVMLAMDMGTGKSLTTIGLLEEHEVAMAFIFGPRRALPVWPREFALHASRDYHVIVPPLTAPVQKRAAYIDEQVLLGIALGKPIVICVNYESAWRDVMAGTLKRAARACRGKKALVLDESHRIKAPGGKASKFCATMRKQVDIAIADTGTPMPHSPLDIYAQYRAIDPTIFGTSFSRFRAKYAIMGGFEGRQVVDYQNMDDFAARFGSISFVCKSDEVLDLPEFHHVPLYCELEPKARRIYDRLDEEFVAQLNEDDWVITDNALTKLLRLQQLTAGWLKDDDGDMHRVSNAKEELLTDTIVDFAEDEPLVMIGRFHTDLDIFEVVTDSIKAKDDIGGTRARRYGELSGRLNERNPKYGLNDKAHMRDDIDVIGLQLQAGGVGIDLTRARYNLFYSMGYNLGDYEQVLKRSHRPGQTRPVTYYHLIALGTKDEAVYEALTQRKSVVEAVVAASRKH